MKTLRNVPSFSHLFFADDLVLFTKADHGHCLAIWKVLDVFCEKSRQTVSKAKSRVYFSSNVSVEMRDSLCDVLGFRSTPYLGKNLGIKIKHLGSSSNEFIFILDRMKMKLAGWKANLLSMAGRSVIIQSSLSIIPSYVMQCAPISNKVPDNIDRISRNFL